MKTKKKLIAFTLILLALDGIIVSWEFLEHIRDDRITFRVSHIEHPLSASQGEPVVFEIHATSSSGFSDPLLKIRSNFVTKTVSGDFYWYLEWGHGVADVMIDFRSNYTREFSSPGIWTIKINDYTTSITIM